MARTWIELVYNGSMKISAKAEYACVALVELANRYSRNTPVSLKGIAEQFSLSPAFLTQVFMQLKGAGIVVSARGSSGGYQLARKPEEITLAEVLETVDGPTPTASALADAQNHPAVMTLQAVWQKVDAAQQQILCNISLADLLRQAHEAGAVFYQI